MRRLAENPRDVAAAVRVLSLLPGIGAKKALALFDALEEAGGDFRASRHDQRRAACSAGLERSEGQCSCRGTAGR